VEVEIENGEKKKKKKKEKKKRKRCLQTNRTKRSSGVLKEREESEIEDAVANDCFERRGLFFFLFWPEKGNNSLAKNVLLCPLCPWIQLGGVSNIIWAVLKLS